MNETLNIFGSVLPALMGSFLSDKSIHLTSLEYEYSICLPAQTGIDQNFNQALANQTSLQKLSLKIDAFENDEMEPVNAPDGTNLVECLSKLVNLTLLRLKSTCYTLVDQHIVQLASCLPKLAVCSISGSGLTDAIWGEFGSLRSLRRLELDAVSNFTPHGILGFIESLGPGNKGLVLSLTDVDDDSSDSWKVFRKSDMIQETIAQKINGKFEFEFEEGDLLT